MTLAVASACGSSDDGDGLRGGSAATAGAGGASGTQGAAGSTGGSGPADSGPGDSSAGSSGTAGVQGSGGADSGVDSGLPAGRLPLKLSADRRYLVDQGDRPFLIHGEAAWSLLVQLTREQVELYLEDRRRRGFNLLMVNLVEHLYADNPPLNIYGQAPFTTPNNFGTPNEAYFAHADWVIGKAAEKGIVVLLCPAYLGFDGGEQGWYEVMLDNGPAVMREYGRFVGARYRDFDNIFWLEGGDYTPPNITLTNAVAEGIKERDTRHLHAAHWSPETSGAEVQVTGWLDVDTTYTYEPAYLKSLEDYNRSDGRPHFFLEGAYEEEHESTPQSLRAQAYHSLLTGAVGQLFGHRDIWQFNAAWQRALGSPGSVSMTHVRSLFESVPWTLLVPDQSNRILVSGQGTRGGADYAVLAASADGSLAMAYLPALREITVNLLGFRGPVRARWYDVSNGTFSDVNGSPFATSGNVRFRPSGNNASGQRDWVLLLEAS